MPVVARVFERAEPFAAGGLRRNRGIVDQRVQFAVKSLLGFGDSSLGVAWIGQIDLDVIFRTCLPGAIFRKRMAGAGDDAPAGSRGALDCGGPDAAAGSVEKQGWAR